jgi:hypothetical protein
MATSWHTEILQRLVHVSLRGSVNGLSNLHDQVKMTGRHKGNVRPAEMDFEQNSRVSFPLRLEQSKDEHRDQGGDQQ